MTQLLPPKKEVALALLERSNVDVYLDPRTDGVVVPPQFRKEPRLILKIGLNMPVPIPDLRLDDESMSCTLSFNRTKFFCVVPWMSVFAMVGDDGRGMVWPDDVPQELAVRPENKGPALAPAPSEEAAPTPSSRGKGKSRLQPDAVKESENVAASERGPQSKRPARKKAAKNGRELEGVKRDDAAAPERARPVLVAVPSPKSSPRVEKLDDHREASASLAERPEREQRPAAPRMPAAPPRPKRELPPYLRVVK